MPPYEMIFQVNKTVRQTTGSAQKIQWTRQERGLLLFDDQVGGIGACRGLEGAGETPKGPVLQKKFIILDTVHSVV